MPFGPSLPPSFAFKPSPSFKGAKGGYAFKTGDEGLGYYLDSPPTMSVPYAQSMPLSHMSDRQLAEAGLMLARRANNISHNVQVEIAGTCGVGKCKKRGVRWACITCGVRICCPTVDNDAKCLNAHLGGTVRCRAWLVERA